MASYTNRSISIFASVLLGLAIAGCSGGDDGSQGATGPDGPPGPPGTPGPSTGNGIPISAADKVLVTVTDVDVPAGGGNPTVFFKVTNSLNQGLTGLPAGDISFVIAQLTPGTAGGSSEWQSYVTRANGGVPDVQATTENGSAGDFEENGDGTYEYTFASALTAYPAGPVYDENKTHRVAAEVRNQAPNVSNGVFDFVPFTGGPPTFERRIVDNDTCDACHDRLEIHGADPGPRTDVEYCVTCHNPSSRDGNSGLSVDMKVLIHNIHAGRDGYAIVGYGGAHDYSDIEWTQDIRNCQTCHDETDTTSTPQAENWRLVPNRAACGTCHYDDGDDTNNTLDYAIETGEHPLGFQFDEDSFCVDCHGPGSAIPEVIVATAHTIPEAEAAKAFEYQVVSATNTGPGGEPTVTIRVLDPTHPDYAADPLSTAYDITDPNGPFQDGRSSLRVDVSWTTAELANLDPADDLGRPAGSGTPFGPITIDFKSGATNDGTNTFTKSAGVGNEIPSTATGSGLAVLEGRPRLLIGTSMTSIRVTADSLAFAITDASPQDRRSVVDIDKCNDCHNNLTIHGSNRTGNTELCSTCHNPNATDVAQRGVADTDCDNLIVDTTEEPIDFKRMIHRLHSANLTVCGYNNSAHIYTNVVYPGHLNNCEGCHLPGAYYPVDPANVLATTILTGPDRSILGDDTAISPNTAVCSSCHTDDLAAQHMIQNGGDFDAGKDETGALVSFGVETCELCHGPGRTADVKEMHDVDSFLFN
jgi:OmcA/MtrC family decaheme c-type cytochrome